MPWSAAIGGLAAGAAGSLLSGGGGGGGGSAPSNSSAGFSGPNTSQANQLWSGAAALQNQIGKDAYNYTNPAYLATLQQQNAINYNPLQQQANLVGQKYNSLADQIWGGQRNQYQGAANLAGGQQQKLYDAGNDALTNAFDPRNELYNHTQRDLSGQVNAGQALRGLGNSAVGAAEYNDAMSTFNNDWQNQQLARQAQGINAAAQANAAGGQQAQLMAQLLGLDNNAAQQSLQYYMQGANTPLQTQQMIAGMPAQNASQYGANLNNLAALQGNIMSGNLPYIMGGQGAQQFNTGYNTQQNSALANLGTQLAGRFGSSGGDWLSSLFGGGSSGPSFSSTANLGYSSPGSYGAGNIFSGGGGFGDLGSGFSDFSGGGFGF